jgi:hypothetical protein
MVRPINFIDISKNHFYAYNNKCAFVLERGQSFRKTTSSSSIKKKLSAEGVHHERKNNMVLPYGSVPMPRGTCLGPNL